MKWKALTVLPALYRNFEKFDDIQDYVTRFLGPKNNSNILRIIFFELSCQQTSSSTEHRGTTADSFTFTDIYGKEFEYDKSQKKFDQSKEFIKLSNFQESGTLDRIRTTE